MAKTREPPDAAWPPPEGAYDYVATLNDMELAWEFLRRNPGSRQAVAEATVTIKRAQALPTGQIVWEQGEPSEAAARWNLCSFRRPEPESPRCASVLAIRNWYRDVERDGYPRAHQRQGRSQLIRTFLHPARRHRTR